MKRAKFWLTIIVILVALGFWARYGFYKVPPGSYGVETIFGKIVKITDPGKHWGTPPPLGHVEIIPAQIVAKTPGDWHIVSEEGIPIKADITFRCRVLDPAKFYLATRGKIENLLIDLEYTLIKETARRPINYLISDKEELSSGDFIKSFTITHGCKADVSQLHLSIPKSITAAVEAVKEVRIKSEKQLKEALNYANIVTEEARLYAEKLTRDAFIQFQKKKREIKLLQNQYETLLPNFKKSPDRIEKLLNIQIIQELIEHSGKIIVAPEKAGVGK